jgi:hypothetical protein
LTATATATPPPSSTPTAASSPTRVPPPTLPPDPVLGNTVQLDDKAVYEIRVAPLVGPIDEATATDRAVRIGALVGLAKPRTVYQDPIDGSWYAVWAASIGGYPVDDHYNGVLLHMGSDGSVIDFYRVVGPTTAKPARPMSKAKAIAAVKATRLPDTATLAWSYKPAGSTVLRLVWVLEWQNAMPDGESWPCVSWVDAGTAELLDTACVS